MATPIFLHGKNTRVFLANPQANTNYDISQFFNDVSVAKQIEATETTSFLNGGVKTYIRGIKSGAISLAGMYEGSASGIDAILTEAINNDGDDAVLVFPDSATATSTSFTDARCYMARGIETKYDLKSPVSGVVAIDTEIQGDGGVWSGKGQYIPSTVATGAGTLTTSTTDNLTSSANGGLLILGCLTLTGTSPTISISFQHSSDGTTWVTPSGATLGAVGTTVLILTGTIYRYTRLTYTLGGTSPTANIYFGFARY